MGSPRAQNPGLAGLNVTGFNVTPDGVRILNASGNTVGPGNVISDNAFDGVDLRSTAADGASAVSNTVRGNKIGTDLTGEHVLSNGVSTMSNVALFNAIEAVPGNTNLSCYYGTGLYINGARSNTISANVISGNWGAGIEIVGNTIDTIGGIPVNTNSPAAGAGSSNLITGNKIGTDATGKKFLGNTGDGVFIYYAMNNLIQTNVISGNETNGVDLFGPAASFTRIINNVIGGAAKSGLANAAYGILLDGPTAGSAPKHVTNLRNKNSGNFFGATRNINQDKNGSFVPPSGRAMPICIAPGTKPTAALLRSVAGSKKHRTKARSETAHQSPHLNHSELAHPRGPRHLRHG